MYHQLQPLALGIIHAFKCIIEHSSFESHNKWQTASRCCTNKVGCIVYYVLHSRGLDTDNSNCYQELFCKMWFSGSSCQHKWWRNKCTDWRQNDWHSLQPLQVQSEEYKTSDNPLEAGAVHIINQVLDQQLTRQKRTIATRRTERTCGTLLQRTILLWCSTNLKMN